MAIHHGGSGNPLDRDTDKTRETQKTTDTDIEDTHDFNTVETVHFEDLNTTIPQD